MKLKTLMPGAIAGLMASALLALPAAAEVTLRYSNFLPTGYVVYKDIQKPWIDAIEEATNGRVKIDVSPKVIGSVSAQFDVVVDGLADISFVVPGYSPGRFQLLDGLEASFLGGDASKRCPANWNAYKNHIAPTGYLDDVKVLSFYCTSAGHFVGKNQLKSLDDFKGLKIRVGNAAMIDSMSTLDTVPINKPAGELYEMASGGQIDSAIFPLDTILGFKLNEIWKQVTLVPGGMSVTPVMVVINKQVWEKLPEEDRQAILSVSEEALANRAGKALSTFEAQAIEELKASGVQFETMDQAVVDQIREKFRPVLQKWIDYAKANGLSDPEAMLAELEAASK